MTTDEQYMHRCLQLAAMGAGFVAPNPMVGAVLVYEERIIGEGYHMRYGQAHAEVNCINSVAAEDQHLISLSTIYVSLEPCTHYGKTPPCADLIIAKKIPRVVVGCRDPFKLIDGKGIEKLKAAGIDVAVGILEKECIELNKQFFTFHTRRRPYIILKWAQTSNKKIAAFKALSFEEGLGEADRLFITNTLTNKLVHKWRSEEAGILVGTNTALLDDPELNNRLWSGKSPVRLVVDMHLRLPHSLKIFNQQQPTIIFNSIKHEEYPNLTLSLLRRDGEGPHQILNACYQNNIQSVLVEGGAKLLQSFIDKGLWDEARIITNESLVIEQGLSAPELSNQHLIHTEQILTDRIDYYTAKDKDR